MSLVLNAPKQVALHSNSYTTSKWKEITDSLLKTTNKKSEGIKSPVELKDNSNT